MTEKLALVKDKVKAFAVENGVKACLTLSTLSGSAMAMTMSASADDGNNTNEIVTTAGTVMDVMTKGYDWIVKQPVLSFCFIAGIVGTVIFSNIKKAKRAVK